MDPEKITIEILGNTPVGDQAVEIVERKGLGHPDSICDAVMEAVSVALSREYVEAFGRVLHHNVDKGLLSAGVVEKGFGYGKVIRPMEFFIGDRATFSVGPVEVPVAEIVERTVKRWFKENLKDIDTGTDLKVSIELKPGSAELVDIFRRKGEVMGANDTSAAVGSAPFTPLETAVYDTEMFLNSKQFKKRFPETGEDVKVMGIRTGRALDLTVAMPLKARCVSSESDYFSRKEKIYAALTDLSCAFPFSSVKLNYNTLDVKSGGGGLEGVYLTLLGTSAEDADSGQVGRGNRVNGLISLNRPTGTEAAAGKNPVSHVGKIYSVLAHRLASAIYKRVEGLAEVYVWLVSEIGAPIDDPKTVYVQAVPSKKPDTKALNKAIKAVVEEHLSTIGDLTTALTLGKFKVC